MYSRFTEPDMYNHIGNERNTLVCTRIDIEGLRNQRVVLTVPVTKLRYFEDYTLVIRQPIPHAAQGLPLYIRAVEDKAFIPDVSAGFGFKINDDDDGHGLGRHTEENALEANDRFVEGHFKHGEHCDCDDCVEIIRERVEAKIFPVTTIPYGNLAFGENLTNGHADEPCPFICLYLNDQNEFAIRREKMKKCHYPKRRLVKITEVITREPKMYEAIDRDILAVPYGHERKFRSHDYFIENGCGGGGYNW